MISVFACAQSNTPVAVDDLTFDELAAEIESLCYHEHDTAQDKTQLPLIGPYRLRDGATRAANAIETMASAAWIDVDHDLDIDALQSRIDALGLNAIVYGSPSDDPEGERKARIIVELDREHTPAQAWAVRAHIADALGVTPDPSTSDASRGFFAGRLRGTPPRFFLRMRGEPYRIDRIPAPAPALRVVEDAPPPDDPDRRPEIDAAQWAVLGALGSAGEYEGRKHHTVGALGGVLRQAGWTRRDAEELVRRWIEDDARNTEAGVRWALGAWDKPTDEVSGRIALARIVGDRVAAAVCEASTIPYRARRATFRNESIEAQLADDETDGLRFGTLTATPTPRSFLVPELEIGVGRAYGWLGKSNASKTLSLMQLEVDLALGRPVFGRFRGPGYPIDVLHIAYEGFNKCAEDYARLIRGTGVDVDWSLLAKRLRFAEGRRFLTADREGNAEWLTRVSEPYRGGLVAIDPFIAACTGLDENTSAIADPLYDIEHVSQRTGAVFVVAHHLGHGGMLRSRGHSSIEGAFGANAVIAKDENNRNKRIVSPQKLDRYGTDPFGLTIEDANEDGSIWTPTREAISQGKVSWSVRVFADDTPIETRSTKESKHAEDMQAKAQYVYARLSDLSGGVEVSMTTGHAREYCGCSGRDWHEVGALLQRMRGVRVEQRGNATIYRVERDDR